MKEKLEEKNDIKVKEKKKKKSKLIPSIIAGAEILLGIGSAIETKKTEGITGELIPKKKIEEKIEITEKIPSKEKKLSMEYIYNNPEKIEVAPDKIFNRNFEKSNKISKRMSFVIDNENKKIFFADLNNHQVHIFNKNGEFIKSFGQKGKDFGNLNYPVVSEKIFKNQISVISRYGKSVGKVSNFNLKGECINEFSIDRMMADVHKLSGDRIICHSFRRKFDHSGIGETKIETRLLKIKKGAKEQEILKEFSYNKKLLTFEIKKGCLKIKEKYYFGEEFVFGAGKDFSVFGYSGENFIRVVSDSGEINKINVFPEKREKPSSELIKEREEELRKEIKQETIFVEGEKEIAEKEMLEKAEDNRNEFLPYYNKLRVDSEGNLVFISQDQRKIFVYKLAEDKKSVSKIAQFDDNTELGKKILSCWFGKGSFQSSSIKINEGSLLGFWEEEEEGGEYVFKKFNLEEKK
jgi:hypothetical protein